MSERRTPYRTRPAADHTRVHNAEILAIRDLLEHQHGWVFKVAGGAYQKPGMPDFVCGVPIPGTPFAALVCVEVKTGTGVLTETQEEERERIERAHGLYIVAHTSLDVHDRLVDIGLLKRSLT